MLIWEVLGAAALGAALALGATRRVPDRFPSRSLTLATGPAGAVFGALLGHSILGVGHALAVLTGALAFGVALLSLLMRPAPPVRRIRRPAKVA